MTTPSTPQTLPDMRKSFEATIARLWPGKDLSIGPDGCYWTWRTENDWLLWQAALAAQPAVAAIPEGSWVNLGVTLPEPLLQFDDWLNAPPSREVPEPSEAHAYRFEAYHRWERAVKELRALALPPPPAGQQDSNHVPDSTKKVNDIPDAGNMIQGGQRDRGEAPTFEEISAECLRRFGLRHWHQSERDRVEADLKARPVVVPVSTIPKGFLSDVMTAAGLVEHGKKCKPLAERLAAGVMTIRAPATAGEATAAQGAVTGVWTDWNGGIYTGDATAMVEVRLRDPKLNDGDARPAAEWWWQHTGVEYDIVAYRVLAPSPAAPGNGEGGK